MGAARSHRIGVKIRLLVVGRGARELANFESRFLLRLKACASFQIVELPEGRGKQVAQRKQEEQKHILAEAGKGFILFDERGKALSSMDWAAHLRGLSGDARLDFVIGGADGVADEVRQAAGRCWSLSALTLPHQFVRAMVLEQLYRAFTILQGHPYHRV